MKRFNTHKLFYKSYPYKIQWYSHLTSIFRGDDLVYCREMLDHHHNQLTVDNTITIVKWRETVTIPVSEFYKAQKVYQTLSKNLDYKVRVEYPMLTIYSVDREWLYQLATEIDVDEWWEPNITLEPNILIMGPKMKGWEFKVTLGPNIPLDFYNWVDKNHDKIKIGNKLFKCIAQRSSHLSGYYFYVKSEKMLSLITMILSNGIQRIDKIVIEDRNV